MFAGNNNLKRENYDSNYCDCSSRYLGSLVGFNARNGAIGAKTIDEKIVAENALSSALSGLKITLEAYPDLKANQNFLQLQEEIADLENKLSSVRRYFNSATKEYNNAVETFPSNILAGMFGFRKEVMFDLGEQRAALEEAPKIKF